MMFITIIFLFLINPDIDQKSTFTLEVDNIRNNKGKLKVALYRNAENYQEKTPFYTKSVSKEKLQNGSLWVDVKVEPGEYGVAILDDENDNNKMDYSFFMPSEGYGFSNYEGNTKPSFEEIKISFNKNMRSLIISLNYL